MPTKNPKTSKNKTAHVLSLLTDTPPMTEEEENESAPEAAPAAPAAAPAAPSVPEAARFTPPVEPSRADEATVEADIRSGLESAFAEELAAVPAPSAPQEPEPAAESPAPEAAAPEAPAAAPEAPAAAPAAPAPTAPTAAPVQVSVDQPVTPAGEISCMNVMHRLVEDKVDKYMKMSKMCTCLRCRTDVVALALNNLPPKYVVMKNKDLIPMTALFEGRFNTAVVAQLMGACAKVKACPRHDL